MFSRLKKYQEFRNMKTEFPEHENTRTSEFESRSQVQKTSGVHEHEV